MNHPFQSIRWRLQAWHGLMLLIVLAAFGCTAFYLVQDNRMRRVDAELQRRALPLLAMLNRFGGGPGDRPPGGGGGGFGGGSGDRPPGERGPGRFRPGGGSDGPPPGERRGESGDLSPNLQPDGEPRPPRPRPENRPGEENPPRPPGSRPDGERPDPRWFEGRGPDGFRFPFGGGFNLPSDIQRLFEDSGSGHYYYVIWSPEHEELRRSTNAPTAVHLPEITASLTNGVTWRTGTMREFAQTTRRGAVVLVGHDISSDLAEINRLAWLLLAAGGGVLTLGLAGGWWLATRAIEPIAAISATAGKIAEGNLSERINLTDTDNEFGQLGRVLNNTFDRLKASFERQVQFTADASHELRTPVSVMLSQTQTALKRERSPEEYRQTVESCQRAAGRMRELIESLLALARLDSGEHAAQRTPCELDRVVRDSLELLQPLAAEQNIILKTSLSPVHCLADAAQLGQVVTNLVSNALHYNRPGGEVEIEVRESGKEVLLVVKDTGQGIAPEDLEHVFERFYRADKSRSRSQGRTGLGLAITKAIVEAHGGRIEVTSEPGKGSRFVVKLPVMETSPASAS